jgi:uncharacterized protein YdeI (YjbR/CyaY-like superfamily)
MAGGKSRDSAGESGLGGQDCPAYARSMVPRAMITDPDAYFRDGCGRCDRFASDDCSARQRAETLAALRGVCLGAGLVEAARWGHPCYVHAGRNIAILGAFRGDVRLTFFSAGLLVDRTGLLTRQGAMTRTPDCARFTDAAQVAAVARALGDLLAQAKAHAEAGTKPARVEIALDLPEELTDALDADPALSAAFESLTPGRRKSHVLAIGAAKARATRLARVAKLAPLIRAGKGTNGR